MFFFSYVLVAQLATAVRIQGNIVRARVDGGDQPKRYVPASHASHSWCLRSKQYCRPFYEVVESQMTHEPQSSRGQQGSAISSKTLMSTTRHMRFILFLLVGCTLQLQQQQPRASALRPFPATCTAEPVAKGRP